MRYTDLRRLLICLALLASGAAGSGALRVLVRSQHTAYSPSWFGGLEPHTRDPVMELAPVDTGPSDLEWLTVPSPAAPGADASLEVMTITTRGSATLVWDDSTSGRECDSRITCLADMHMRGARLMAMSSPPVIHATPAGYLWAGPNGALQVFCDGKWKKLVTE